MNRAATLAIIGLLLALTGCGKNSSGAEDSSTGVAGIVYLGPQCPVETVEEPCPDAPAADVVVVVAKRLPGEAYAAGETVATGKTDSEGAFRIDVAPGEYVVTAQAGMSCELMDVVVADGELTTMDVPCDTGIRGPTS